MIKSMTAYARIDATDPKGQSWIWEIRAVNHRYLEQHYRLPDQFRAHEFDARTLVNERVNRGKLEINVKPILKDKPTASTNSDSESTEQLTLNTPLLHRLINTGNQLAANYQTAPLTTAEILQWPGMLEVGELSEADFEQQKQWVTSALNEAINDFIKSRETEGSKIANMISERCQLIQQIVDTLKPRRENLIQEKRDKLIERIAELQVNLDAERLEQEVALLAQKLDVSEELDRLDAHLEEVQAILKREDAVGRRLDFMMQELNREANTLGSKSADQATTQASVDIKVLLEQMREQIQNIE